ncbi:MAG: ABC-F family ATP-binding cassette domain-containing protein [Bacteroidales bacterium]
MISVERVSMVFGGFTLLEELQFVISKRDRIALVGKNGAGKSTLMKIIAGHAEPTAGVVSTPKDLTIGYLPQHMVHQSGRTVREEAELAFAHIFEMQKRIERMTQEMSERTDYESDDYIDLIDRLTYANEQLAMMGGDNFMAEVEKTLMGLGFLRSDMDRQTTEFSGGWRMRIELAKLLLQRPDVLLLDEPTNHLDIESIQWLEQFLASRANAVVLISHDRAFLDAVTNRTIEITLGRVHDYRVSYSKYVVLRAERREQQLRAFENQQKQIQETEAFIERFRYQANKAVQVQSRIKQLDKIDRIEVDEVDNSRLFLRFSTATRSGEFPIIAEGVSKFYGDHEVFSNATFTIKRGEKVAFVGKNGEGKSTLVKCIMEQIQYGGSLKLGHNVKIGYFAQNQAQLLDDEMTVFETVDYVAVGDIRTKIRDILGMFMFGGEASDKKVKVLSGGERSRLAMIRLLLEPVNLLILDEPTNHLDMLSKDILKQAIKEFEGTVIVVSHDRQFLDGLVEKVYEFGNKRVVEHLGSIYEFLERKKMDNLKELEMASQGSSTKLVESASESKLNYEARKELQKAIRKIERSILDSEKRMEKIQKEIDAVELKLTTAEGASDVSLYTKHGELKKSLAAEEDVWTNLTIELEDQQLELE